MAYILAVDNEERMCKLIRTALELDGHRVDISFSGAEAQQLISKNPYDIVVTDLKMSPVDGLAVLKYSRQHSPAAEVILITAFATQETALQAMKDGAYDYLIKPFKMDELALRIARIMRQKNLERENRELKKKVETEAAGDLPGFIGKSNRMRQVFQLIRRVAENDTAVLIRGESGTGKELVASAIHRLSQRRDFPFVAINCAALPENLLESELFGYEKGAFTGADRQKKGLLETASGGILFLDEIGDLPLSLQAKLLRVLQNNELIRLGGQEKIQLNFRLITATHQNLEEMIGQQRFRSDLFYRINIFPIVLPALRERKEDIPELIQFFLRRYPEKSISSAVRRMLIEYDYPGNVRELENIIARAVIMNDGVIDELNLPGAEATVSSVQGGGTTSGEYQIPDSGIVLDDFEKQLILQAIRKSDGNKSRAAELLGITRRRLYSMMERFGLPV